MGYFLLLAFIVSFPPPPFITHLRWHPRRSFISIDFSSNPLLLLPHGRRGWRCQRRQLPEHLLLSVNQSRRRWRKRDCWGLASTMIVSLQEKLAYLFLETSYQGLTIFTLFSVRTPVCWWWGGWKHRGGNGRWCGTMKCTQVKVARVVEKMIFRVSTLFAIFHFLLPLFLFPLF